MNIVYIKVHILSFLCLFVFQVMKVQATIVGKKPHLALPHRRLVCYCRLYEITDIHKKERPGVHQREVILISTICTTNVDMIDVVAKQHFNVLDLSVIFNRHNLCLNGCENHCTTLCMSVPQATLVKSISFHEGSLQNLVKQHISPC